MKRYLNFFILAAVAMVVMVACCNEDNPSVPTPEDEPTLKLDLQPTTDQIKTFFHGTVFYGGVSDALVDGYIKPRIAKSVTDIDHAELDFVLISDAFAGEILNNADKFNILKKLWNRQRAIGFVDPAQNALILLEKLNNQNFNYELQVSDEMLSNFSNIKIFVTVAGLKTYVHEKYDADHTIYTEAVSINEDGSESVSEDKSTVQVAKDGYSLGLIAEGVCEWLNKKVSIEDGSDPALVDTRYDDSYTYGYAETTWEKSLCYPYNEVSEYNDPNLATRNFKSKTIVKVTGAFCESDKSDIYDVEVLDKFPISQIYFKNYLLDEYGVVDYKDKYTGACYLGPTYEMNIKDADGEILESGVGIYSASPQIENGDVTTTHNPATASFGSSVSGGISAEGPDLSVGLSSSFTLPNEATTHAYKEMQFNYTEYNGTSKWEYIHDGYWIYDWTWGFNGRFDGVYGPAHNDSDFSFMLTFKLDNSRSYGEENLYFNSNVTYQVYSEVCKPKEHTRYKSHWGQYNRSLILPIVYRYFGRYAPSCYSSTIPVTDDAWVNLKSLLEDDPTYRAMSNESVYVGARVEKTSDGRKGVEVQAERIWNETMEAIIKQRNGHNVVEGEWVIGLYGEGAWLKRGLHIKGNEWKIIDDVTEYGDLGL